MPPDQFRALLEAEALRAGHNLSPACLDQLAAHHKLLVKWNRAVRLIGSTEPHTIVHRHVVESLALLPFIHEPRGSLLDIGSGNGFPAIPLKCVLETLRIGLVEPTLRKSFFLRTLIMELGLSNASVLRTRVDRPRDLAHLGRWDCISMRGVAAIPTVMKGGAAALRSGGRLLFMVGEAGRKEVIRHLAEPLELVAEQQLTGSRGSYLVVVGMPASQTDLTVH